MMLKVLALVLSLALQEPAPRPADAGAKGGAPQAEAKPAESVPELVPGELPAGSSEEVKALWRQVVSATTGTAPATRIQAFDLEVDSRAWQGQAETDFDDGRIRFLAPRFVESLLKKDGRKRLVGPQGYFLVDPAGRSTRLQGVELENDRKELDRIVHVAKTFANLIDPRALRLRSLALAPAPPPGLPPQLAERVQALRWIAIDSPDFAMADADGKARKREVRATIGIDPKSTLPQFAHVVELEGGRALDATALLVGFHKWGELDGFRVPYEIETFAREPGPTGEVFVRKLYLWLHKGGTLRAPLKPEDFVPPDRR